MSKRLKGRYGRRPQGLTAPLRKIIDWWPLGSFPGTPLQELLECGHIVLQRSDIIGPTNAVRRRCKKCRRGDPPDRDLEKQP